ncbi:MAG TPA: polysaccharide deacetylase family protein, partial [Syntrophobacteraceae bacterium]|nr:polysaccharide deacetylase family protein [Syntrophobacteraceae bacterium]
MIPITPKIRNLVFSANLYRLISLRNLSHIVTYHMISDSLNGFYPETATKVFERQIAHLSKNYEIIPLDEVSLRITTGRSLRRSVAITFDDGFRDNYEKAYPILKRYNAPATIFVAAGYIESGDIPWFIRLRYIFKNTDRTRFQLRAIGSDGVMP